MRIIIESESSTLLLDIVEVLTNATKAQAAGTTMTLCQSDAPQTHQMHTEDTSDGYSTLPIVLAETSPMPPGGSVVVCGTHRVAYQRSNIDFGWMGSHSAGRSRVLSEMVANSSPVILVYVPPDQNY